MQRLGLLRHQLRRLPSTSRSATRWAHIPEQPPQPKPLIALLALGVVATSIYAGAQLALSAVAYIEDNDIWRPEDDDD
eukprot:m.40910 g.40910  ORF g.40910 m.40910 type:complete len:78 (+) comp14171_c0_seq1:26-259(+)